MNEFRMPSLGADMESGTLLEWLVRPGDEVHRGQVIAVVDTAKSAIDVETWQDGVVQRLLVEPGTTVDVGTPLAELAEPAGVGEQAEPAEPAETGEAVPVTAEAPAPPEAPSEAEPVVLQPFAPPVPAASPVVRHLAQQLGVDLAQVEGTGKEGRITHADVRRAAERQAGPAIRRRVSPAARRRARALGVDLTAVTGTGADGAVTLKDVDAAAATGRVPQPRAPQPSTPSTAAQAGEPPPTAASDDPAARNAAMRAAIGALMSRSKREIPHYYLAHTIELTAALGWLRRHNADLPVTERVLPAALFARATALAAMRVPAVNGWFTDGAFHHSDAVHLGVAVNLRGGGLVTPAMHDAHLLSVDQVMAALSDLVVRARAGHLRRTELTEGTITLTSLGERGVELVQGVIVPPQVALVGIGTVVDRPWAVGDAVAVRPVVTVTFSGDHRAGDGHLGARFLATLDELLQTPEEL